MPAGHPALVGLKGAGRYGKQADASTTDASKASVEERSEARDRSGSGLSRW
jgi:hypothetical protein